MMRIELQADLIRRQEEIAAKAEEIREKFGLRRLDMPSICGVSIKTLWKLSRGHKLSPGVLLRIQQGLDAYPE